MLLLFTAPYYTGSRSILVADQTRIDEDKRWTNYRSWLPIAV
jgi:hypothetical protein